jgi:hypothetical protein
MADIMRQDNDISGASQINTSSNEVSSQGNIVSLTNSIARHRNDNTFCIARLRSRVI